MQSIGQSGLPTEELVARSEELRIAAGREAKAERQLRDLRGRIERAKKGIGRHDLERQRTQELKRHFRKDELAQIDRHEASSLRRIAELEAEARGLRVPSKSARRELALADRVLAERRELAITAARIAPPAYIRNELGERSSDPAKRKAWDRGVREIETYRQRHGVKDRVRAFGPKSRQAVERTRQGRARHVDRCTISTAKLGFQITHQRGTDLVYLCCGGIESDLPSHESAKPNHANARRFIKRPRGRKCRSTRVPRMPSNALLSPSPNELSAQAYH